MHRRRFLEASGLAVLGSGCGRQDRSRQLLVGAGPYISMAPLHLALEDGYFSKAGLDVRLESFTASGQVLPPLAAGKLDVSFIPVNAAVVNAVLRGARIRVVAGRELARPNCEASGSMLIRKKSFPNGLRDFRELRGKRISFNPRATGNNSFWSNLLLDAAGLTEADVTAVDLAPSEEPTALALGQIDAAMNSTAVSMLSPRVASEVEHVDVVTRLLPNYQYSFILFGSRLVDGDVSVGAAFLAAYFWAVRDYVGGRDPGFLRDYAESNGLDYEALRKLCRTSMSMDGSIDLNSLQRYLDWAVSKGYCDRAVEARELADYRFLEAVRREPLG